jgi:ATP-binding cassette subfamily B protein
VLTGVMVAGALGSLTEVYGDLLRGAGAASQLDELLNEKPGIAPPARPVALPEPPRGGLRVQTVTCYPTRPDAPAVLDFNLTVEPGETVATSALRGPASRRSSSWPSGSTTHRSARSTSTACRLLEADPPTRRRMRWCRRKALRGGARDNLRYGNWEASEEAIWEAARAANAEDFLRRCQTGSTPSSARGELSGGQRQRRDRPRAAARRADPAARRGDKRARRRSERLVQQALERLMGAHDAGHRAPPGDGAGGEPIVVMDHGRIVEEGDHARLRPQAVDGSPHCSSTMRPRRDRIRRRFDWYQV